MAIFVTDDASQLHSMPTAQVSGPASPQVTALAARGSDHVLMAVQGGADNSVRLVAIPSGVIEWSLLVQPYIKILAERADGRIAFTDGKAWASVAGPLDSPTAASLTPGLEPDSAAPLSNGAFLLTGVRDQKPWLGTRSLLTGLPEDCTQ